MRGPVDLSQLLVAVNVFSGSVPGGAVGEIRIVIDGETWGRAFRVPADRGNRGAGFEETMRNGTAANAS